MDEGGTNNLRRELERVRAGLDALAHRRLSCPLPADDNALAHQLRAEHAVTIAVETIYQARYCSERVLERDVKLSLRTKRRCRRPRRRGDQRRSRFIE